MKRSVSLAVVLAGCALPAFPQTPAGDAQKPSDTLTLHVSSRLVVLDVVVVDRNGHPVSNLDRSQFTITEDKAPQTIRNFDPPAGHTMPTGAKSLVHSTADLAKIGNAPVNILVFDELNTRWEATAYAREMMQRYLKAQPETLPVPTQLLAAGDTRFVVLHDYTQSRAELLEAVKTHFPQYPWQMMKGGSGNNAIDMMGQTLGALSQIAESSRGTPGRKNVIWVGSGYPTIDTTNLPFDDEDKLMSVIRMVTDRMLSARVTLYMVEPTGVQTTVSSSAAGGDDDSVVESQISNVGPYSGKLDFSTFARATGGDVFFNRNDVDAEIRQSVQEGGVYYTLAYAPTNTSDEAQAYRKIRVKVKDPSLRVIARDGYFAGETNAPPPPVNLEKPEALFKFDLQSAARVRLAYNGLKVQAKVVPGGGYRLLVGAKDLHFTPQDDGSQIVEVSVMTSFFSAKDKQLQSRALEIKERVRGTMGANSVVELKITDIAPPATARVRFVVRDAATGVIGTADLP